MACGVEYSGAVGVLLAPIVAAKILETVATRVDGSINSL